MFKINMLYVTNSSDYCHCKINIRIRDVVILSACSTLQTGSDPVCRLTVMSLSCSSSWDFSSTRTFSAALCSGFSASSSDLWPFFCWVAVHNNRGDALSRKDTYNNRSFVECCWLPAHLPDLLCSDPGSTH